MSQELTKNLICVLTRSGVEIWLEKERIENLIKLVKNGVEFIECEEAFISKGDFAGVYTAAQMADRTKRKNGQYQCSRKGKWHDRFEKCDCEQEDWFNRESKKTDEMLRQIYQT